MGKRSDDLHVDAWVQRGNGILCKALSLLHNPKIGKIIILFGTACSAIRVITVPWSLVILSVL